MKYDARVIGIPNHLAHAKKFLAKPDYAQEAAKFEAAEAKLLAKLPAQKKQIGDFFRRKFDCISHFQCERFTFMRPLHEFACFINGTTVEEVFQENAWTEALHIVLMGPNDCLVVPFDVPVPMNVEVPGRKHPYTICSAPRITQELDLLDEYVAIEQTMGVRKFDAFVSLSNADMEKYEKQEGVGRRFWAKWGVAALRGLMERATKNNLPVIVDPQFSEVPATAT